MENPSPLTRTGEDTAFLPALQTLRGIAALLVVLFHTAIHVDKQTGGSALSSRWIFCDSGVQFFFVLSGFIICHSVSKYPAEHRSVIAYFRKRFIRIYPSYWILLISLFFLYNVSTKSEHIKYRDVAYFIYSLTLLPNERGQYLGVAWTLSYEIFFYVAYSIVVLNRRLLTPVAVLLTTLGIVRLTGIESQEWAIRFFLNPNMALFPMGIMTALVFRSFNLSSWAPVLILGGLTTFALSTQCHAGVANTHRIPSYDLSVYAYGMASSLIILGAAYLPRSIGAELGNSSYALYITHIPVIAIATFGLKCLHIEVFESPTMALISLVLLCQIVAIAFHLAIERPVMSWANRKMKS